VNIQFTTDHEKRISPENPEASKFALNKTLSVKKVKMANFPEIIEDIFSKNYDPANVNKLRLACESRDACSLSARDIGMESELPVQIFQLLCAFV